MSLQSLHPGSLRPLVLALLSAALLLTGCLPSAGALPLLVTPAPGAAWQTFRADSGYEISYPLAYYSMRTGVSAPEVLFPGVKVVEPNDAFALQEPRSLTYKISIAASENTANRSLDRPEELLAGGQLIAYDPGLLAGASIQEISLAGFDALRVDDLSAGPAGITAQIVTMCNDRVYELLVEPHQLTGNLAEPFQEGRPSAANLDLVEQIIASFRLPDCTP